MGDERDRPWSHPGRRRKPANAHTGFVIVEAHAIAAAELHFCLARQFGEPLGERRAAIALEIAAGQDGGGVRPARDRLLHRLLQARIGHPQEHVIHGFRQISQRRIAGDSFDLAIVRIDRIDAAGESAAAQALHHAIAHASGLW